MFYTCTVKWGFKKYGAANRGTVIVKWLVLDFTLLCQSAIQNRGLPELE
jgi:hypothetical protein